jgi:uncharacterized caspase-like protein
MKVRGIIGLGVVVMISVGVIAGCASSLFDAAQYGYTETVKTLLDKGANVNVKDGDGRTALMIAVRYGHTEIVKVLLDRRADVNAKDNDGWTALIWAIGPVVWYGQGGGHIETIKMLLDRGAEVNAKDNNGRTALMRAAWYGHTEIVKMLLERGAEVNAKDKYGWTALMRAKQEIRRETVNLLKQAKAKEEKEQEEERKKEEREKQEAPASPNTSVNFSDSSSCIPNNILDAGEEGILKISVKNDGKGIGFGIIIKLKLSDKNIDVPKTIKLGDIKPGETIEKTIKLKAGLDIPNGQVSIIIDTKERRGYDARKVMLILQTAALIPPKLEIQSVEINDGRIGLARGNGNGIVENNESIELIAYIKNSGTGDALGVNLNLASINPGLKIIKQKVDIGLIHPGQTVKGKLAFSIPRTFKADQLKYKLKVADVRGADSRSRQFATNFRSLFPALAYTHRIYDGNSANSKGNRNGIIENGETIEIEIIPKNTGDIEAEGVEIALVAPYGLSLDKTRAMVGTIPAQAKGEKKSFVLPIPRTYQDDSINLDLNITQADFPSLKRTLALEVNPVRPRLSFTHRLLGNIQQGQSAELEVIVRNEGKLDAEGVKVAIDTKLKGIDLRTKEKPWGRLPAGAATDLMRFGFFVKRSAPAGQLPIHINITQADFPAITDTLAFNIREEGVVEVAVKGQKAVTPAYSRPVSTGYNIPPVIVIVSPSNTEKSYKPEVTLVANIADDKEVSRVRVKLNDRLIADENFRGIKVEGNVTPRQQKLIRRLKLESGQNRITVVAYDNENQVARESVTVYYHKEKGEIWAVLIGIGAYQKVNPLNYTTNDIRSMKDYLVNDFGVPEDHVTVLLDQEATLARIKKVLGTELRNKAGREDQVIIYFAGHGAPEEDVESPDGDGLEKYLLPYDVDPNDLFSTALPMRDISVIFQRIKAERLVFLADTCFSGASGGKIFMAATISDKFWERISRGKGRVILTASRANEVAQAQDKLRHGVFTYYLLEGLRGEADLDGDGVIDTEEAYRYVSRKVPEATGQQQNPIKKGRVEGQIVLGRVR